MAAPLAALLVVITAGLLWWIFPSRSEKIRLALPPAPHPEPGAAGVAIIAGLTVLAWITTGLHHIPESVTALMGVIALAGFRCIGHDDLKSIPWDILLLMGGGLALGQGVWLLAMLLCAMQLLKRKSP